ncbi:hypothetical protein QP116_06080 [Pseudoglutamicibacter cumminsii]|uniref:DUF4352 domain-containing protein n=1 Tax=Pseudoglutamicibacter cumminsii TaxID=156979 RepID=A0AAP4C6R3_9MICC|nr:hypothetical protein [Pseudoglutamicibacter cumminsii]MDK6275304.1 hypothetical protein [Pseudoglutamicibacter cumminsii]
MFKSATSKAIVCLGLATSLALTGCSVGVSDEGKDNTQNAEQASAQQQGAQPQDGGSMTQESEPAEGAEESATASGEGQDSNAEGTASGDGVTADSLDALASTTVRAEISGDKDASLTVELLSVERKGDLIETIYGFTANTDTTDLQADLFGANGSSQFWPYLIDQKNLNRHSLVRDASDNSGDISLMANKRVTGKFVFPAPPEDVHEMDFQLWEGAEMAKDVKID